jgi:hypothetical protein
MKKAIFTVVLGSYDYIPKPKRFNGWDNILFTDHRPIIDGYNTVYYVKKTDNHALESRRFKWLSHIFLSEYDLVCYIDGNMQLRHEPESEPFRIFHEKRKGVFEEAEACNGYLHRCTIGSINEQIEAFKSDGFKDDQGLYYGGFFCRKHSKKENELCELVYEICQKYTPRDQLAFPYALWKLGYKPENIKQVDYMHKMIKKTKHRILKPKLHGL